MQNQIKKFMFTPWKRPQNWLSSFKPGNTELLNKGEKYKVVPIARNVDRLKSNIDLKCNKLEQKLPQFGTTMKEAFLSRHHFNDDLR